MNYNDNSWRNSLFGNKNKISINEIIECMVSRYNEKYDEMLQSYFPEFYDYSKKICDILNESNNFKRKIYTGDITIYDYFADRDYYRADRLKYKIGDSEILGYTIDKKALKINIDKKWRNYNGGFSPSILSFMEEDTLKFINSIPKYAEYDWGPHLSCTSNRNISSCIPDEIVNNELERLKEDENLQQLYINFKNAYSPEKIAQINDLKKEYAKILLSQMIEIDNENCKYLKLEVLNYDKPIEIENLKLVLYDEKLQVVDTINSITDLKTAELQKDKLEYKKLLEYKTNQDSIARYLNVSEFELQKKYYQEMKILNEKRRIKQQQEELQKKFERSKEIHEEIKSRKENAIRQIAKSIKTMAELGEDKKIGSEIPQEVLFKWDKDKECYQIREEFRDNLKYIDLSFYNFDNVDVSGIDFRGCNPILLDPQKVYNKDLSNTRFDITEDELRTKGNKCIYIPGSHWDLDSVNLKGANLYAPLEMTGEFLVGCPKNIDKAIMDENTVLPELYKKELSDKMKKNRKENNVTNLSFMNDKLVEILQNEVELGNLTQEEAYMMQAHYIGEKKGGKKL